MIGLSVKRERICVLLVRKAAKFENSELVQEGSGRLGRCAAVMYKDKYIAVKRCTVAYNALFIEPHKHLRR